MEEGGYKTLRAEVEGSVYKDKKSKFIAFAMPVSTRIDIDRYLETLRTQYPGASHYCYAWRLGTNVPEERTNDDGEPRQTAGAPILGQINSFGITNALLVVIRYYGGKKLGTGGLITAYRSAARSALEKSVIIYKEFESHLVLHFSYAQLHKILHEIKSHDGNIKEKNLDQKCRIVVSIGNSNLANFLKNISRLNGVRIEEV
ncbi:MAG: YigZ family protein [Flavobacteriaceae bacterium]